jgi:putative peptidoglycan lipid II flippase
MLAILFPLVLPLLASRFGAQKLALTENLFYLILPFLTFSVIAIVWSGVLNAYGRFAVAAAAPAVVPILIVVALFAINAGYGVKSVATGMVVGSATQCLLLAATLSRLGVPLSPRWGPWSDAVRDVFSQYAPAMAGTILASSTLIVDQSMSAMLPAGSVAAFNYGSKLVSALLGIGMLAIGTAVLPHFSTLAARSDWRELERTFKRYAWTIVLASIPGTLVVLLLSRWLVHVMFERGAFLPADTDRVAFIQQLFVLQTPFYLTGILIVRLISALKRNSLLLWGAIANVALNIVFNLLLMRPLGVAGIALSTTLVYVAASTGLGVVLLRELRQRQFTSMR